MTTGSAATTRSYWRFQIVFWSVYFVLNIIFARTWGYSSGAYDVMFVLLSIGLFGLTHFYRWLYLRYGAQWPVRMVWMHLLWLLPLSAVLVQGIFAAVVYQFFYARVQENPVAFAALGAAGPFVSYVINTIFILLTWCLICLMRVEWRRRLKAEQDHWQNQLRLREVELQFLRSQINSHFLFNALNNIRALVREDAEAARQALSNLATLLRGVMQGETAAAVRLDDEIEMVKGYLALEALQLEQRLRFDFSVDPALHDAKLPPLLLQTLVENAVKHGIARLPDGGTVRISAAPLDPGRWQLLVENPSAELPARHAGNGIGLRNARERLRAAFGDLARLDLTLGPTVRASVELPL